VREGVAFTHNYCQSPLCTPSRASFLTGKYASTVHVNTNGNTHFPPDERLVTRRLADAGYDCGLVGKLHLAGAYYGREPRTDDGYAFFRYSHAPRDDWQAGHDYADWLRTKGANPAEVLRPRRPNPGGLVEPSPDSDNVPVPLHQTTWCAEEAIAFITGQAAETRDRRPDQPWLLSVNPYYPHPPFNPRWEYYRRHDAAALPGPHFRQSDLAQQTRLARVDFQSPARPPEEFAGKKVQAAYYAMVEMVDAALGEILAALERTGQRERTLVLFHSDHGEALGDHGLTQKGCRFYDGLARVPMIWSWPGHFRPGLVADALVEQTDIVPTLMDLAGHPVPPGTHGRSLLPILTGAAAPHTHRDFVRCEYYDACDLPNRTFATMYRDRRYKLVAYHGLGTGELYDLERDPYEFDDLWDDPAHQALKLDLLQRSFDATVAALDYGPRRIMPY
jgi:arylsulfatase A-like enzyme